MIEKLKRQGVYLNREGDYNEFWDINIVIVNSKNKVTLTQTGLTDKIVKALGLQAAKCDSTHTPADYGKFPQDKDRDP